MFLLDPGMEPNNKFSSGPSKPFCPTAYESFAVFGRRGSGNKAGS